MFRLTGSKEDSRISKLIKSESFSLLVLRPSDFSYLEKTFTGNLVFQHVQSVMVPSPFSETSHWPSLVVETVPPRRPLVSFDHQSKPAYQLTTSDLTKYASHVYVLVRRNELRASKIMAKRLTNHPKVTVLWNVSYIFKDLIKAKLIESRPLPPNAREMEIYYSPSLSRTSRLVKRRNYK